MSAHTPGPWRAERVNQTEIEIGAETPAGHMSVAWVWLGVAPRSQDVAAAMGDAHLLAAAPELLEALRDLLSIVEEVSPGNEVAADRARAAIAKAEDHEASHG